jgi:GDPmannose 4,6-dehydratase
VSAARRVFVVGAGGQDGKLLEENVARSGGVFRGIDRHDEVDIFDPASIGRAIEQFVPDELHYLAAYHHSSEDRALTGSDAGDLFAKSFGIHVTGLVNTLEAVRAHAPACCVFYAASSHVFAGTTSETQDESTPFAPVDAYGITKVAGVHVCRSYRARGLHVSVGFLYNHESSYRGRGFVSSRIVDGACSAREAANRGEPFTLKLGNLGAIVDWGYAPDYVVAMRRIAARAWQSAGGGDDYVIATGVPHTVGDFAREAFSAVGLDFRAHVEEDAALLQKRPGRLIGDATKLHTDAGWAPTVTFEEMVKTLVRERLT